MLHEYGVMYQDGSWYVWTVPDHQVVSRAFAVRGEADAELTRIEAAEENHRDHMAYKRNQMAKEAWHG